MIDPTTAKELIARGAVVLDVRRPDEFDKGHLPNATNIPVQELTARIDEVGALVAGDRSRAIVVHCAAGKRAATAKDLLERAGYAQVVNGGGYDDLK